MLSISNLYDLHLHSTASDGQFRPADLVAHAKQRGIAALSLTDHDSIGGLEEAADAARQHGIRFIPGVELSVDSAHGDMHILGYGVRLVEPLTAYLEEQMRTREERNRKILRRLQEIGCNLTWEDVLGHAAANAKHGEAITVGRPHFAMALIAKSYVLKVADAFNLYLGKGKPAYVERKQATAQEAIAVLNASGGVAVLAHPFLLHIEDDELASLLRCLKDYGLEGVEAYHSDHTPDLQQKYCRLAAQCDLLVTGGSDFHGPLVTPGVEVGRGKNRNLKLGDMRLVDRLADKIAAKNNE